jgi:hypothetical protein
MFLWKLTPATTALPPAKSRHRSEPPTPLSVDADQNRRACLSSRAVGGCDLKEVYEEGGKQGEEGTGAGKEERPRMGRQRSRSAGEGLRERPGYEFIYPAAVGG